MPYGLYFQTLSVATGQKSDKTVVCLEDNKESCSKGGDKNTFVFLYKFANKKVHVSALAYAITKDNELFCG
jgi:hypothetical protein